MNTPTVSIHSAVAATVTTVACAWFLVAGATMLASPTDNEIARSARVTVQQGAVMPEAPAKARVAASPDARFTITVEARRA